MRYLLGILLLLSFSCKEKSNADLPSNLNLDPTPELKSLIQENGMTLESRFKLPTDFQRKSFHNDSFEQYLRSLPLKPVGTKVKYFDGKEKNPFAYEAVVDLTIGKKDLHQCADAIMRLRAEYLWKNKKYHDIHFNFTNGFKVEYKTWLQGGRMKIEGNKTKWIPGIPRDNTYTEFWSFMELIFTYAGTASLEKELESVELTSMKIGDVFIKGGHPGHVVIIVDMAKNAKGEQLFMLGQSYMPAQEFQILKNLHAPEISPWYRLSDFETLNTPEWTFTNQQLKRFK